jgi:hypothetical protein
MPKFSDMWALFVMCFNVLLYNVLYLGICTTCDSYSAGRATLYHCGTSTEVQHII